jgi:hypothetical protein
LPCDEEAEVWWVTLSRAIRGVCFLGVPGDDAFWPRRSAH